MDAITTAAVIQAAASLAIFAAACVAAYVTWKAPERAARLAEDLRASNERAQGRRREKMRLFRVLMNHRGRNISATKPVNALNMINVVFHDNWDIREAYQEFLEYANGADFAPQRNDAYLEILVRMAKDLGLSETVSKSDIDRGYYP